MTATLSRGRDEAQIAYTVRRLTEADEIRKLLDNDREYAAYAIAQLDPKLFDKSEWYTATGQEGPALVLHSRSGLGRALFVSGDPGGIGAILSLHAGPRFSFGSLRLEHRRAVERYFAFTRLHPMLRMSLTAAKFHATEGAAVRLHGRDVPAINRLYSSEGGPASYSASHVEDGVYFGVMMDGSLASIAGTHVVSHTEGVGVVGNVFTSPRYRGLGLATIATSAVTADLLERCPLVVLTVEEGNDEAVRIYKRLGYETRCKLHETPLIRKEPLGVLSWARRVIAGWRGRADGKEVVLR
jgi:GNAT superfamily N-acetyltransferase